MPIDLETFRKLEAAKVWPKVFECECGRRLLAGREQRSVKCSGCGTVWQVREEFVFNRTREGTTIIYFRVSK